MARTDETQSMISAGTVSSVAHAITTVSRPAGLRPAMNRSNAQTPAHRPESSIRVPAAILRPQDQGNMNTTLALGLAAMVLAAPGDSPAVDDAD